MRLLRFILTYHLLIFILVLTPGIVWAQGSYTYSIDGRAVPGPAVFEAMMEIYGDDLGIGAFKEPQDLTVSPQGLIYIADTGNNRIVVLEQDFQVKRVINEFQIGEQLGNFSKPRGLFVGDSNRLYIADYDNRRIVVLDEQDQLLRLIQNPEDQELIPKDFSFRPLKLVVDGGGHLYVIAEGVLEGLMEFDETGIFTGFIGAPRVNPNPWQYFWRLVMTDAQKERSIIFVPTEYSNVDIDDRGFIYTTLMRGRSNVKQVIRRLNPAGDDVLRRPAGGFAPPMADVDHIEQTGNPFASVVGRSALVDIVVRESGIYSAVDLTRGRVFTYDDNGNLLYVFGNPVFEKTGFRVPAAIDVLEENLLILDSRTNLIALLQLTEYANLIHQAIALYQIGDYGDSAKIWRKVLHLNPNLDIAYGGIGRALLRQGDFLEALRMFRLANDRRGYSQALAFYRRNWINANFSFLMGALLILVATGKILAILWQRRQGAKSRDYKGLSYEISEKSWGALLQSLGFAGRVITRPADGFWDLKHEKRGNVWSATIILIGVVFTYILIRQHTGFLFNRKEAKDLNVYLEMASVLIPFFLWCGVNLGLTSLMEGKGSFRDVYIATAYALVPIILLNLPLILVSRVITLEEGVFYHVFTTIAALWSGFLIFMGMLVTHQYELGKNVLTSILTGVGMGVVIFLTLLFLNVIAQLYSFLDSVYTEISFRL